MDKISEITLADGQGQNTYQVYDPSALHSAEGADLLIYARLASLNASGNYQLSMSDIYSYSLINSTGNGVVLNIRFSGVPSNTSAAIKLELVLADTTSVYGLYKAYESPCTYADIALDGKEFQVTYRSDCGNNVAGFMMNSASSAGGSSVLAITGGGTGANNKLNARENLGIKTGTASPSGGDDGDIYIKYKV